MFFKSEPKGVNWLYLFVAFLFSVGLWYTLSAKDQVERVFELRLDYKGLPPGLVITEGQLNKVSVRVRGPMELLRSSIGREQSYTVDLSGVTKGNTVIPLVWDRLPESRAYDVLEVIPSRLVLRVEEIMEAKLPVKVSLRTAPVTPSLRLRDVEVQPPTVTVRGPQSAVSALKEVTAEIPPDLQGEDKLVTDEIPLFAPSSVEVSPQVVSVTRRLDVRRRTLTLQRDIVMEDETLSAQPSRVSIVVSVPQALARDSNYLEQFQVSLSPGTGDVITPETASVSLQVTGPQGGRVIKLTPETVSLVRSK